MMTLPSSLAPCTSPASCTEARVVGGCACAARRLPSLPCSAHRARAACFSQVSRRTPRFGRARPRTRRSFSGIWAHGPRASLPSRCRPGCFSARPAGPGSHQLALGVLQGGTVVPRGVHTQAPPLCPTHALWGRSQTPPLPPASPRTPGFCVYASPRVPRVTRLGTLICWPHDAWSHTQALGPDCLGLNPAPPLSSRGNSGKLIDISVPLL